MTAKVFNEFCAKTCASKSVQSLTDSHACPHSRSEADKSLRPHRFREKNRQKWSADSETMTAKVFNEFCEKACASKSVKSLTDSHACPHSRSEADKSLRPHRF